MVVHGVDQANGTTKASTAGQGEASASLQGAQCAKGNPQSTPKHPAPSHWTSGASLPKPQWSHLPLQAKETVATSLNDSLWPVAEGNCPFSAQSPGLGPALVKFQARTCYKKHLWLEGSQRLPIEIYEIGEVGPLNGFSGEGPARYPTLETSRNWGQG